MPPLFPPQFASSSAAPHISLFGSASTVTRTNCIVLTASRQCKGSWGVAARKSPRSRSGDLDPLNHTNGGSATSAHHSSYNVPSTSATSTLYGKELWGPPKIADVGEVGLLPTPKDRYPGTMRR